MSVFADSFWFPQSTGIDCVFRAFVGICIQADHSDNFYNVAAGVFVCLGSLFCYYLHCKDMASIIEIGSLGIL